LGANQGWTVHVDALVGASDVTDGRVSALFAELEDLNDLDDVRDQTTYKLDGTRIALTLYFHVADATSVLGAAKRALEIFGRAAGAVGLSHVPIARLDAMTSEEALRVANLDLPGGRDL